MIEIPKNCKIPVRARTNVMSLGIAGIVVLSTLIMGLMYTGVIPISSRINGNGNNLDCLGNQTLYLNQTQMVYECKSNLTVVLPIWPHYFDENGDLLLIQEDPSTIIGTIAIKHIRIQIICLDKEFADRFYSISDEGESDTFLEQCEQNHTQIGYEERNLYLRNPKYYDDLTDDYIWNGLNETFSIPADQKAVFLFRLFIDFMAFGYSETRELKSLSQSFTKENIINYWQCENKTMTFDSFEFNDAGHYLDKVKTTFTSNAFATEEITFVHV
jgi:hypothetical protein